MKKNKSAYSFAKLIKDSKSAYAISDKELREDMLSAVHDKVKVWKYDMIKKNKWRDLVLNISDWCDKEITQWRSEIVTFMLWTIFHKSGPSFEEYINKK